MAKYRKEDILKIALNTFPSSRLTQYGFYSADAGFVSVMKDKGAEFRQMYDYYFHNERLCRIIGKEKVQKTKMLRDIMLGLRKKAQLSVLEEITVDLLPSYQFTEMFINFRGKTPEFIIYDTANQIFTACHDSEHLVEQQAIGKQALFLKFAEKGKKKYVIRKTIENVLQDYMFTASSGKGDFAEIRYSTRGVCSYSLIFKGITLQGIMQKAESLQRIKEAQIKRCRELKENQFMITEDIMQELAPVNVDAINAGVVAAVMKEKIDELEPLY
jgi:hypothetical protein